MQQQEQRGRVPLDSSLSLLQRLAADQPAAAAAAELLVPVIDYEMFRDLAMEALQMAREEHEPASVLIIDAATAEMLASLELSTRHFERVYVLDAPVRSANNASGLDLERLQLELCCYPADRVLVLQAGDVLFGLLGTAEDVDGSPLYIRGGWSVQHQVILPLLEVLLEGKAGQYLEDIERPRQERAITIAMRLMNVQAHTLAQRQRSVAKDKDDLLSVLNILKAISAKRRAHDILYVFVEQISHVVPSDRCSIVRVWGDDVFGHVLASHDDAHINGRDIDLTKYPELRQATKTRRRILINDTINDPLTAEVSGELKQAGISALLVIPIVLFDPNIGSLFLRSARRRGSFTLREISFFEIVAEAASNALERAQLFEGIQLANERLEKLAITDGLTGLYNQRHFRDRLEAEFQRALRYHLPLSCMLFDVDDFKAINDTHGHLQGDHVLREIATRTRQSVRHSDFVARYGGEEFVIIMPQTELEGAAAEADRIRLAIGAQPFRILNKEASISVSVGVSSLDPEKMLSSEDLVRVADQALYDAKRAGKNRVAARSAKEYL